MQVRSLQFSLFGTNTPSCESTGEESHPSFGPVLPLWDVFLHLVSLQIMGKITNQQFLWTVCYWTLLLNVWMFGNQTFMPVFTLLLLFFKNKLVCLKDY